jgi:hypothetical protein
MAIETATVKPSKRQPKEPKVKAPKEPKTPKAPAPPKASKGSPAAKTVVWPSNVKPSLVFLPEKIRDAQAYKRSVRQAMMLSVASLGATAVIYAGTAATSLSARGELAEQTTLAAQLKGKIASNQQVQEYYDGFIISKQVVSDTLKSDTAHSRVLNEIQSANTVGAQFQSIKKKLAAECPSGDPFAASVAVGCFELSGTAPEISSITTFLTGLQAKTEVLTNPLISESGADASGAATFKMTVGYTDKAISGKVPLYPDRCRVGCFEFNLRSCSDRS